ncbi:hypothetical protein ANTPLA_LOCUS6900 [Anthophora plagiata]
MKWRIILSSSRQVKKSRRVSSSLSTKGIFYLSLVSSSLLQSHNIEGEGKEGWADGAKQLWSNDVDDDDDGGRAKFCVAEYSEALKRSHLTCSILKGSHYEYHDLFTGTVEDIS